MDRIFQLANRINTVTYEYIKQYFPQHFCNTPLSLGPWFTFKFCGHMRVWTVTDSTELVDILGSKLSSKHPFILEKAMKSLKQRFESTER